MHLGYTLAFSSNKNSMLLIFKYWIREEMKREFPKNFDEVSVWPLKFDIKRMLCSSFYAIINPCNRLIATRKT